jgi:PiT family inorganic phosphate transporter
MTSAVMGAGATKRFSAVRWGVARGIITAWVVTIPAAAAVGAVTYLVLRVLIPGN